MAANDPTPFPTFSSTHPDTPFPQHSPTSGTGQHHGLHARSTSEGEDDETLARSKEGVDVDWYVEGPGRRVGYDDLTAIDWIFEYTKERQRLRKLFATSDGLLGYARQLLDASHVWFILVFTGISIGLVAAGISIASDWLGDIKTGYCRSGEGGGQFYLNKQLCCFGHDGQCRQDSINGRTDIIQSLHNVKIGHHGETLCTFPPSAGPTWSNTYSSSFSL